MELQMVLTTDVSWDVVCPFFFRANNRVSILRSGLVNSINFTLYESLRKHISVWEEQAVGA
jgi:hypothetical protein